MGDKNANIDTVKVTAEINGVQRVEKIVNDYNVLDNKPQINNVELTGNKTLDELNIQPKGDYVIDSNYVHTDNNYSNDDKAKLDGLSNYTLPKASGSVLGGIMIGDNLNIDGEGKVSVIVTDGEDGATFTPSVDDSGNLSWTNNKSLPNPDPVNIKGPKGDTGEQGEQGEQGLPGATGPGVPTGGTTGQILTKNSNDDYDTIWKDVGSGGIPTFIGTEEQPINALDYNMNINNRVMIWKGYIDNFSFDSGMINAMKTDTNLSILVHVDYDREARPSTSNSFRMIQYVYVGYVSLYGATKPAIYLYTRTLQVDTVAQSIRGDVWRNVPLNLNESANYKVNLSGAVLSQNGANNLYTEVSEAVGYTGTSGSRKLVPLTELQTTDKSSLVGAINELVSRIEALEGTGE